jgi:hypothetical protein
VLLVEDYFGSFVLIFLESDELIGLVELNLLLTSMGENFYEALSSAFLDFFNYT